MKQYLMKQYLMKRCMSRNIDSVRKINDILRAEQAGLISKNFKYMLIKWIWLNEGYTWEVLK